VKEIFLRDPVMVICLIGGVLLLLPWHKLSRKPPEDR